MEFVVYSNPFSKDSPCAKPSSSWKTWHHRGCEKVQRTKQKLISLENPCPRDRTPGL